MVDPCDSKVVGVRTLELDGNQRLCGKNSTYKRNTIIVNDSRTAPNSGSGNNQNVHVLCKWSYTLV